MLTSPKEKHFFYYLLIPTLNSYNSQTIEPRIVKYFSEGRGRRIIFQKRGTIVANKYIA